MNMHTYRKQQQRMKRATRWLVMGMILLFNVLAANYGPSVWMGVLFLLDIFVASWVAQHLREELGEWIREVPNRINFTILGKKSVAERTNAILKMRRRSIMREARLLEGTKDIKGMYRCIKVGIQLAYATQVNRWIIAQCDFMCWMGGIIEMALFVAGDLLLEDIQDGTSNLELPDDMSAVQILDIDSTIKYRAIIRGEVTNRERNNAVLFGRNSYERRYFAGGSWHTSGGEPLLNIPSRSDGYFFLTGLDKEARVDMNKYTLIGKHVTMQWLHRSHKKDEWKEGGLGTGMIIEVRSMLFGRILMVHAESTLL